MLHDLDGPLTGLYKVDGTHPHIFSSPPLFFFFSFSHSFPHPIPHPRWLRPLPTNRTTSTFVPQSTLSRRTKKVSPRRRKNDITIYTEGRSNERWTR